MQATLDAYAANPILNQLLDNQPEQQLAFGSEDRAIVDEFKKKRRQVQLPLNLLMKEKRERGEVCGLTTDYVEAQDPAMAAEGSKEWYKAHRGSHPHEWPQKMKERARQRAATALATGSSSSSSATGSRAAASSANRDDVDNWNEKEKKTEDVDAGPKGAEEDQPATDCTASTGVAQAAIDSEIDSRIFSEGPPEGQTYRRYGNIDEGAPPEQKGS